MSLFVQKFSLQWHRDMIHSVIHWHSKFAHQRIPIWGRWSGLTDMYDHLCPDTFFTTGTFSVNSYTLSVQSNKIQFRISKKKSCLCIIFLHQCYFQLQGSSPWSVAAAVFNVLIHFSANYGTWWDMIYRGCA